MHKTEIELEKQSSIDGCNQFKKVIAEAKSKQTFGSTAPANIIISSCFDDFVNAIERYIDDYSKGRATRSTLAASVISRLKNIQNTALVVARIVLDNIYNECSFQALSRAIGQGLEDEQKMELYREENLAYYKQILKDLQVRGAKKNRVKTVINYVFAKQLEFHLERWNSTEKAHAGMVLLELFCKTTGLIEIQTIYNNGKTNKKVVPSEKLLQLVEDLNSKFEVLHPQFLPMVVEPKPWKDIFDGGYLSPYLKRNKLIKNNSRDYLKQLSNHYMPEVYSAINHLQNTAWQINEPVLKIIEKLRGEGCEIAGLPTMEDEPIIPYPFPEIKDNNELTAEQLEEKKAWKRVVYEQHKRNVAKRSLRILTAYTLRIAQKFRCYEKIYFPYQMDFRGRLYPIPVLLQPQGSDLAKGLLRFAEGKPVNGNENAIKWLTIHGANMFGFDKVSYEERIKWVKERESEICSIAENPFTNRGWTEADKPIQFLAWCIEYAEFLHNPTTFETHIPIQLDGTCNGLQHFSALLRDKVAGKAVNLIDSEVPSDIYQQVSDKTKVHLEQIKDTEIIASKWLELGFDRKLTKRPVMTLPYGVSEYGCREFVSSYLIEHYSAEYLWKFFGIGNNPNDCVFKVSRFLSKYLWLAIKDTLKAAITGMAYFKKLAGLVNANNDYIEWKTPAGLIVRQNYKAQTKKIIRTELYGSIIRTAMNFDNDKIDKRKQINGISPNFIHSLDAACLMIYINKCKKAGINSLMTVHDCYAVHATDTEHSAQLLREAFVEVYHQPILENFVSDIKKHLPDDVELPALPQKGMLEIEDVFNSKFFFN